MTWAMQLWYRATNATYPRSKIKEYKIYIYIGATVILQVQNNEKLSYSNGKLIISESSPHSKFQY